MREIWNMDMMRKFDFLRTATFFSFSSCTISNVNNSKHPHYKNVSFSRLGYIGRLFFKIILSVVLGFYQA